MVLHKGFSLIELMVVIAVVSILAVVATPAYQNYVIKAKVANARVVMDGFAQQVKGFYAENGRFPTTVTELGYPAGSDPAGTPTPTNLSEYLAKPYLSDISISHVGAGTCPGISIAGHISNFNQGDGVAGGPGDVLYMYYNIFDVKGIFAQDCEFYPPFSTANPDMSVNPDYAISSCTNVITNADEYDRFMAYLTAACT